jgi:hypothetical protein
MKKALALLTACAFLTGCHLVPTFHSPISFEKPAANQSQSTATPVPVLTAVQQVVQKQVWLFWIAGVVCLCVAGACAYFGQYIVAVKVGLAGLILPIFATWWSEHYALAIAAILLGMAVWYFLAHRAALQALEVFADKQIATAKKNL